MKPSTFLWAKCNSHQQPCFPTALRRPTPGGCSVTPGTRNFLRGKTVRLTQGQWFFHSLERVNYFSCTALTSNTSLWPSFSFLLSLSLRRWRCCSDPGLTEPGRFQALPLFPVQWVWDDSRRGWQHPHSLTLTPRTSGKCLVEQQSREGRAWLSTEHIVVWNLPQENSGNSLTALLH